MNDKTPLSHPHEYYVDLVKRTPKVPPNEITPDEREHGHGQFGNNFYLLFLSRLRAERAPDPQEYKKKNILAQVYLNRAESKYQKQWPQFLDRNRNLIEQIDAVLDSISAYSDASDYYIYLLKKGRDKQDYSEAEAFEALGIESMGIYTWRQLNPLLEKAADRMKDQGINPKEFFG